jgi:hypothetical protein
MKKVKIIDSAFAHCKYSNNPLPPLQTCEWMEWDRDLIFNRIYEEPIFITESNIPQISEVSTFKNKIAWLLECRSINSSLYKWISDGNYRKFNYVLSHDRELVKSIPNGLWVPFGGCWVDKSEWNIYDKTKMLSIVASEKSYLPGHIMRHQIIERHPGKIDLFGRRYNPIENKIESLRDYQYQIVIENDSIKGYFTEKLIDCFMTGTIPIYWGDPTISQIFDTTGMIIIKDLESLSKIINDINSIDLNQFANGIQKNFEIAKDYILTENYIHKNYPNLYE